MAVRVLAACEGHSGKKNITAQRKTDELRELAMRQIINAAVVSDSVVDSSAASSLLRENVLHTFPCGEAMLPFWFHIAAKITGHSHLGALV